MHPPAPPRTPGLSTRKSTTAKKKTWRAWLERLAAEPEEADEDMDEEDGAAALRRSGEGVFMRVIRFLAAKLSETDSTPNMHVG